MENSENKSFENFNKIYSQRSANTTFSNASNTITLSPLSFIESGRYHDGLVKRYGHYWSLYAYAVGNARKLYFYSGYIGNQNSADRGEGLSLRCLAR